MRPKILIVDDMIINRTILVSLLEDTYEIIESENGAQAIKYIENHHREISLILLDLVMPVMDGFAVLMEMKERNWTNIPVIVITAENFIEKEREALLLGAVDFIPKPFDPIVVSYRIKTHVSLKMHQDNLLRLVEEGVEKVQKMWTGVIFSLADIIEKRSYESGTHVKRTSEIVSTLLHDLQREKIAGYQLSDQEIRLITETSALHDVGKIAIPDNILNKPGRFTDEEYTIMKTHSVIGESIVTEITKDSSPEYQRYSKEITRHHHERWDGRGYPDGLTGLDIPLSARVVTIADALDAMLSARCYKDAYPFEKVMGIFQECSGTQFDPILVDVLIKNQDDFRKIA